MRSCPRARPRLLAILSALLMTALFAPLPSFAQSPPAARKAPPPPPPPSPTDQEQFLSYWTTETGWRTELQLRSNLLNRDLTVTPVLRTPDGGETPLSPVIIKGKEVQSLDLNTLIGNSAPQVIATYGSLVLRYHSTSFSDLYAVAMIRGIGHSIAFHIDGLNESPKFQSGSREGIWWLPNSATMDYLILVNQSGAPLPLDLGLFDAGGKSSNQKLTLAPRALSRLSVRQLVAAAGLTGSFGGIKISVPNHAGSLDSLHFLFDEKAGFSAVLKMFDYDPKAQIADRDHAGTGVWTLRAPMLALSNPDPALAFPVGTTLRPQIFVRNTAAKPINASLLFNWRSEATTGKAKGPVLRLNPFETRRIDVAALQDATTLPQDAHWASVTLTTDSQPREVVAVAASYDSSLHYGAQTPFTDQLSAHLLGSMLEYDAEHDSIIAVGNGGAKPILAAFTLFYNQGAGTQTYELEQTLGPDEQMWIQPGKLIREHLPDRNGKTLPADLTSGSYEIRDLTNHAFGTLFEAKVIYDKTYGHVTYGCNQCCGYTTPILAWYNPLNIPIGSTADNGVLAYEPCIAGYDDVSSYFYSKWSSNNTSIATVNAYAVHTGVSVGSTTSNVLYAPLPDNDIRLNCPGSMFGPGNPGANVSPTVTIGSFSQNPILNGSTATVTITVNPSATISLAITSSGTGAAKFDSQGGSTTKTISGTTTVTIYGSATSTNDNELTLSASYGGTVLYSVGFAVTSGACTLGGEYDTGSGKHTCPSTVTLQSNYTISQYCSTCSFACVSVHTDGAWTPDTNGCSTVTGHVVGSLTGTATTQATGTFSASDCNWHYEFFVTRAINAQGVPTDNTGGQIGIKCTYNSIGYPCP
jgi:hypothetical protein